MKEKNADKLRDALNRLPQHDAPASVWDAIDAGLTPTLAEKLPTYQPAAGVWNNISRKMEEADVTAAREQTVAASTAKVRSLPLRKLAGIAAAVVLLLTVGVGLAREYQGRQIVTVSYSQEATPALNKLEIDDSEASFERVRQEIADRNEPRLNALGHELAELDEAKDKMKAMLVSYGEDPGIIRQLAEIERDRSDIYRRIIEL